MSRDTYIEACKSLANIARVASGLNDRVLHQHSQQISHDLKCPFSFGPHTHLGNRIAQSSGNLGGQAADSRVDSGRVRRVQSTGGGDGRGRGGDGARQCFVGGQERESLDQGAGELVDGGIEGGQVRGDGGDVGLDGGGGALHGAGEGEAEKPDGGEVRELHGDGFADGYLKYHSSWMLLFLACLIR